MDLFQQFTLDILRIGFFRTILHIPALWYLTQKLNVNLKAKHYWENGQRDFFRISDALQDQREAIYRARRHFYQRLHRDGHISSEQLFRLLSTSCILDGTDRSFAEKSTDVLETSPEVGHDAAENPFKSRPTPMPWERDKQFFTKIPHLHYQLERINTRQKQLEWYDQLWSVLAPSLRKKAA